MTAFDHQPVDYDVWFERHHDFYQAELAAIYAAVPKSGQGVEIGVGTGRFAAPLSISTGVDPSPGMAELARQRGVEVLEGVAEALPLADNSQRHHPDTGNTAEPEMTRQVNAAYRVLLDI